MRLIGQIARPYRVGLVLLALVAVAATIPTLFTPLLIGDAVDAIRAGSDSELERKVAIMAGLTLLVVPFAVLRLVAVARVGYRIEQAMRQRYFDHLTRMDIGAIERYDPGQLVSRGTADLRAIRIFLSSAVPTLMQAFATFGFVIVALLLEEAALASIALVMAVLIAYIAHRQAGAAAGLQRTARDRVGAISSEAEQTIAGMAVIKSFGREDSQYERFRAKVDSAREAVLVVTKRDARYNALLTALPYVGLVLVLFIGGRLAADGDALTDGEFVSFFMYFLLMAWPANALGSVMVKTQDAAAAALRVKQVLEEQPRIDIDRRGFEMPQRGGGVQLHDVSVAYDEDKAKIEAIDLRVEAGKLVALVGGTGAGKSLVLASVKDLYPLLSGSISFGGLDKEAIAAKSLQRSIGLVCDDDFVFSGTVRDAIAYGKPDATDEQIKAAARIAHADEFIAALPHGYGTQIGEHGALLSGGQRQRLALARALLVDPELLLLDDAAASLDDPTARSIANALRRLEPQRTTLIVSQRARVLEGADQVVFMEQGRIVDRGTHDELAARNERYRRLASGSAGRTVEQLTPEAPPPVTTKPGHADPDHSHRQARSERHGEHYGHSSRERLRLLWNMAAPDRRALIAMAVALVLSAAGSLAPALFAGKVVDDVLGPASTEQLAEYSAGLAAILVLWSLANYAAQYLVPYVGQRTMMRLRERLIERLLHVPLAYFDITSSGRLLSRLTYNIEILTTVVVQSMHMVLTAILMMIGTAIVLLVLDPLLALVAYATVPVLILAAVVMSKARKRANRQSLAGMTALSQYLLETVKGARVMRSFAREQHHREQFADLNEQERQSLRRAEYAIGGFSVAAECVIGLAVAALVLFGGRQAIDAAITVGTMVTLTMYLRTALSPVSSLANFGVTFGQVAPAIDSVIDTLNLKPASRPRESHEPGRHLDRVEGKINFDRASFAYTKAGWALYDMTCVIEPGQHVAVVGASGAGKTTFARLLLGFYPAVKGHVYLDGHDIARLDAETLRRHMALVPQEPYLFRGTIADNIAFAKPQATRAEVEQAVEQSGAAELLGRMPKGLDTEVEAGGRSLSSGEQQLVAVCRALVVDPRVLVLDEATSTLDAVTEMTLQQALYNARQGRTTVSIAHRLELCEAADKVLVISHGCLVEHGTHAELVAKGGEYARLWDARQL